MNILFIQRSIEGIGGIMVVTNILAKKMLEDGMAVSQVVFDKPQSSAIQLMDSRIHQYYLEGINYKPANVNMLRKIIKDEHIDVVINQWGLTYQVNKALVKATKGLNIKIISVYHNQPNKNGRLSQIELGLTNERNLLKKIFLGVKRFIYEKLTSYSMRYSYNHSDIYMLLSNSFVSLFKSVTGIQNPKKLKVQTNPLTIDTGKFQYDSQAKAKTIIYVGRLDEFQKRTSRLIYIWEKASSLLPDWNFVLVGDGGERCRLEKLISDKHLKNIEIVGFQNPKTYYEKASILMLTSDFEGFPLVLGEAMSFGVVPIVLGSYAAAHDIIKAGYDGVIVARKDSEEKIVKEMANSLISLAKSKIKLEEMAKNAIKKSKDYALDTIYENWLQHFNALSKK